MYFYSNLDNLLKPLLARCIHVPLSQVDTGCILVRVESVYSVMLSTLYSVSVKCYVYTYNNNTSTKPSGSR